MASVSAPTRPSKAVKPAHRVPANRFFHLPKPARGGNQTVPLR